MCPGTLRVESRHEVYVDYHNRVVYAVERCVPVSAVLSIDDMAFSLIGHQQPLLLRSMPTSDASSRLRCPPEPFPGWDTKYFYSNRPANHDVPAAGGGSVLYFFIMLLASFWMDKKLGQTTRNSLPSHLLPRKKFRAGDCAAVGVFGRTSGKAFVGVVGPLIEIPVLIGLARSHELAED